MAFYENTLVARQDLAKDQLEILKEKYEEIINKSSGKVIKIEDWGLINLASKIKKFKKAFFIHYKFEGNKRTLEEIEKKLKVDTSIIRFLTVKYKNIDIENEYFNKNKNLNEKKK